MSEYAVTPWCDVTALLTYGSYVEADVDADDAVLAGVDAGGAEDAGAEVAGAEDVGVLGEAEAAVGDGDGEADEDRALGDADGDEDPCADSEPDTPGVPRPPAVDAGAEDVSPVGGLARAGVSPRQKRSRRNWLCPPRSCRR